MENWKPIPGHPYYEASSQGRIRSLDRVVKVYQPKNNRTIFRPLKGKIIKPNVMQAGYTAFKLPGSKTVLIHRIICEVFVGKIPDGRAEVNHKNAVKHDNRASNLEWVTSKQNKEHAIDLGLYKHSENSPAAKLSNKDVLEIKRILSTTKRRYPPYLYQVGEMFGVSPQLICDISKGRHWEQTQLDDTGNKTLSTLRKKNKQ